MTRCWWGALVEEPVEARDNETDVGAQVLKALHDRFLGQDFSFAKGMSKVNSVCTCIFVVPGSGTSLNRATGVPSSKGPASSAASSTVPP